MAVEKIAAPLYHALGRAMARWQHVEAGLFVLGHAILKTEYRYTSLIFFHIRSPEAKMQLVDRLCREKFSDDIIKRKWTPLLTDLKSGVKFRNGMAHFEANYVTDASCLQPGEPPVVLTPHHLDINSQKGSTVKGATTSSLIHAAEEYILLSRRLFGFVQAHFTAEERGALGLPPQLQGFLEGHSSG
jgi:hypothetical protein